MFVNHRQTDWAEWLPLAEFAYNNRVHSSTRRSPFEVDTGRHPRMGVEPRRTSRVEAANEFAKRMAQTMEETRSALKRAAEDMARFYDVDHQEAEVFQPGDKVWLDGRNINTDRPKKKLDDNTCVRVDTTEDLLNRSAILPEYPVSKKMVLLE